MGIFSKIANGLKKTRDGFSKSVVSIFSSYSSDELELFDELEELLIMSDVGVETSTEISENLRKKIKEEKIKGTDNIVTAFKHILVDIVKGDNEINLSKKPAVIQVIGVNGAGKTTTIGKLASMLKAQGYSVLLAAADTFRAAAVEQLDVWAQRAGVPIIKHEEGSDPASVVFDAINSAKAKNIDVVICDTAGRLHNKKNLMDELSKISRIIKKELPESSFESLLVLDGITGQNGISQAKEFAQAAGITGIVVTKLDGTAKGGVVFAINRELGIPVKFIGVGEAIDDLMPFDAENFVEALFSKEG